MKLNTLIATLATALVFSVGSAQITVPSDGSDGAFNAGGDYVFNLAEAPTASWNTPAPIPGKGVYDPVQWAVVYKFSSFTYNGGNMYFTPHPSGAPVVILVQGSVYINGTLGLNGGNQNGTALANPGPGGFRGGATRYVLPGSAGFGPGGGDYQNAVDNPGSGSYGTLGNGPSGPLYGNPKIIPLIGGSGGAGRSNSVNFEGGAGGGGAVLIAAQNSITLNSGNIAAYGGSSGWGQGGGSGGAIKLVADTVTVGASFTLNATGQTGGGSGRIRIEANTRTISGATLPIPSTTNAGTTPQIWPDSTTPKLEIISVGGTASPSDPRANLFQPDVELTSGGDKNIVVHAYNVPTDGTWQVQVRMTPRNGTQSFVTCTYVSGNQGSSVWQGTLNFDAGAAALIARASKL